ncbi:FAD-dependent oxidoreductase [Pimelobacter simplex]|uniref:FAD-dependent oxidoreductase n=1 Tax=Nocardioides simplex TaxID=2045 RepID=A0A7J5DXJ6_NOCSI|nr:NAD(P)/FAD-dependent oxidoreductase [Pimelobacter simplex]KAB2810618.1 FAD-dependent oxidoreductase [Pimelobacter simplex]
MEHVDVAIVGAGYAGLAAALDLTAAGRKVVVLEAGDRVGGRVWTRAEDGVLVDHGGQWVGPAQTAFLRWADRFGCARFPTYDAGTHLELWPDEAPLPHVSGEHPDAHDARGYDDLVARLDELAAQVDPEHPEACGSLAEWDSRTFDDWLRATTGSPDALRRMRLVVQGLWACEPREVSLFHVLFYVAAGGGLDPLLGTLGGAQDSRFTDGADGPARAAAALLGDAVRLGSPVTTVVWDDDGATLTTSTGTVRARRVVVTGTPPAQSRIAFSPLLPAARRRWLARSPMGDVAKVHVTYATPFWRARGLSGQLTTYDGSAVAYTFDNSPADGSRGVVAAFVYGDDYRSWSAQPAEARRKAVLDVLGVLGEEAARPLAYHERLWPEEPWAEGAYAAVPTPGTWLAHAGGRREPVGPLHWAGTETAGIGNGYVDGAIRSGERAAAEVLASWTG